MSKTYALPLGCLLLGVATGAAVADDSSKFLQFIRSQAASGESAERRAGDQPPDTLAAWTARRTRIRQQLLQSWGGFPESPCALAPRVLGTLQREGYRVEKVVFQTLPDVWMTANAYVPELPEPAGRQPAGRQPAGKLPAVLCVHGHWRGAKQDPNVQARCVGLARLGFFVLAVDAFGAGERGINKPLGEYHGEMVGATLLPLGRPLSGIQVYENQRAVDYLLTRPEVDRERLGITGASGGGNQTMYAGGWDERFKAVVPVCSVGNYQAYLGAACCMCEVVPGVLRITEEWGVLGLTAPRALMVVSATRDAFQFSVGEAKKSLAATESVFQLHRQSPDGTPTTAPSTAPTTAPTTAPDTRLKHAIFESPHAYNRPMREAMYGWMTLHLKGQGDGAPIAEPEMALEDPETLRCFPGDTRPASWITLPQFAHREAVRLAAAFPLPDDAAAWAAQATELRRRLDDDVLGGTAPRLPAEKQPQEQDAQKENASPFLVAPEPGVRLKGVLHTPVGGAAALAIVLTLDGAAAARPWAAAWEKTGRSTLILPLRATGEQAVAGDKIGRAPDHNSAEWSLLLGRPLLGQWVCDVRAAVDAIRLRRPQLVKITVAGEGPAGVVAIAAAALDSRISGALTIDSLASYLSDVPYEGQRLGILAPGVLRDVGDIQHLAALAAPRPLLIAGGVTGGGASLDAAGLAASYSATQRIYQLLGASPAFQTSPRIAGSPPPYDDLVGRYEKLLTKSN